MLHSMECIIKKEIKPLDYVNFSESIFSDYVGFEDCDLSTCTPPMGTTFNEILSNVDLNDLKHLSTGSKDRYVIPKKYEPSSLNEDYMDNKRKIKLTNYLHNNNSLVYEINPVKEGYRSWLVIIQSEDSKYSFKIRKESFSIEDIENDYDVIGRHLFSKFIYLKDLQSLDMHLEHINIRLEDFTESWNTDYPL